MSTRPSVGILTPPTNVAYEDLLRVWGEADAVPAIGQAWLFDHLMPIGGDPDGPAFEGWTLLAALAARTERLRLGLLVTSNRIRPPALLAKIAATVDVVSGGRLEFGIGVGSRPDVPTARREYLGHGLPYVDTGDAVARLAESLAVIRRLWTAPVPFDWAGEHVRLVGAWGNPKPVQRPHPPVVVGGRSTRVLRIVAEHADVWNLPSGDFADLAERGAVLDRFCAELGRDPASVVRSLPVPVDLDRPEAARETLERSAEAGVGHVVLVLPAPYPTGLPQWVADEVVTPALGRA
ncbi:LLM class flavin-dependent oxidoreductase [Phycicoccus endophyticus]|uniref:LLM class flavin-dependent oxidoreductase n=1 Tax=Phycicoccus endophyticus TaxID=1690220 RepID=A0A7G9R2R4_9MICO|nr:LLM class flavin-dependent oxidoreductase [Phycicoccus endophyticus]NHI20354.1 LLM class flavin-dependent oxidoreductase [Phycicoccus endophyticus]QNN49889.1 LLM class flavin-dependent oxidoreductase [Phycicoccus endophyticus]GGL29901.1 monooxygenase [Phycicoccus endophyticus]